MVSPLESAGRWRALPPRGAPLAAAGSASPAVLWPACSGLGRLSRTRGLRTEKPALLLDATRRDSHGQLAGSHVCTNDTSQVCGWSPRWPSQGVALPTGKGPQDPAQEPVHRSLTACLSTRSVMRAGLLEQKEPACLLEPQVLGVMWGRCFRVAPLLAACRGTFIRIGPCSHRLGCRAHRLELQLSSRSSFKNMTGA